MAMENETMLGDAVHILEAVSGLHVSKLWELPPESVLTLFPGDVVALADKGEDFSADVLTYSPAILREASLDMEQTVYQRLREDRCRGGSPIVVDIVTSMFSLLKAYFRQPECGCLDRLVMFQLKAFFIGFHDYLTRFPQPAPGGVDSKRKRSLFNGFMSTIERDFRKSRDVSHYAEALHITPKYLNLISKAISGQKAKTIIDHYVTLKLKIELGDSDRPIKQLVWDYNFSDASFFTRYFKRQTGLTPLEWRRSGT